MHNRHQEHVEDLLITGDLSVLDFFNGDYEVSLKIDGSPAIVYGMEPSTGKTVVGTKSIFNKVKKKICYTVEDINFHYGHQPKVAEILIACLEYLPKIDYLVQLDFIGFGGTNTLQPNTITYQFPEVITQKIVVAPHTIWKTDGELKDAYVSGTAPFFVDNDDVKFIQPCVDLIRPEMPQIDVSGVQFLTAKEAAEAKKEINALIRSGEELNWWNLTEILGDKKLAHLYLMMIELKEHLIDAIIVSDAPKSYLNGERIVGEGFVCKNEKMIFKLVEREKFSAANFNRIRF
jgi:hypothetical protein